MNDNTLWLDISVMDLAYASYFCQGEYEKKL